MANLFNDFNKVKEFVKETYYNLEKVPDYFKDNK
jgi:hypothetical protein